MRICIFWRPSLVHCSWEGRSPIDVQSQRSMYCTVLSVPVLCSSCIVPEPRNCTSTWYKNSIVLQTSTAFSTAIKIRIRQARPYARASTQDETGMCVCGLSCCPLCAAGVRRGPRHAGTSRCVLTVIGQQRNQRRPVDALLIRCFSSTHVFDGDATDRVGAVRASNRVERGLPARTNTVICCFVRRAIRPQASSNAHGQ